MNSRHIPPAFEGGASKLDAMLSETKAAEAPDPARIATLRVEVDQALETPAVSLQDWRSGGEMFKNKARAARMSP